MTQLSENWLKTSLCLHLGTKQRCDKCHDMPSAIWGKLAPVRTRVGPNPTGVRLDAAQGGYDALIDY